uniref:Uncharacterized protein n=1 Tax=Candidatus Kentrum sp. SD TaxID=2126332 RepID=A0A450YX53_9GAMM|nr:MAG: hypothetical protein BECKSD772F_GA0070984_10664 [Candidatus Kentron sp. SD]VFK46118.1 MAG: hypothetical protein BECKSD772E_GA0070983_10674 [Candidatus Kentron sp. SD]
MIKQTIGELLQEKVVLDIEGIDRMYLNPYQPMLRAGAGVATFSREEDRGAKVASTALMSPMTNLFEEVIRENLDLGRPSWVMIFDRGINKCTPGTF